MTLEKMRATIRAAAPKEATEAISYGMPSFQYKGGLVAYAAFKKHCSLFPMGSSAIEEFAEVVAELARTDPRVRIQSIRAAPGVHRGAHLQRAIDSRLTVRAEAIGDG